jgi:hypothetical protein
MIPSPGVSSSKTMNPRALGMVCDPAETGSRVSGIKVPPVAVMPLE